MFDVGQSGEIERGEVMMLVKMMFGKPSQTQKPQVLKILDKDKDEKLSLTEFMEIQKNRNQLKPAVQIHQMQPHTF